MEHPIARVGLELVRATEAAALAASRWIGRGQKEDGDRAGVNAMRGILRTLELDGVVVIGEGEKDQAPMLYHGERLGNGRGPAVDIAVDPVEGTNLLAKGLPSAISVIAIAPRGTLWHSRASFYMDKLVVGREAAGRVSIEAPVEENLDAVARAKGRAVEELTVVILDRPRNAAAIAAVRSAGARVRLITDGDVAPALMTALPDTAIDMVLGVGGTPEGVITACAMLGLGGEIQGRLAPQSESERTAILAEGVDLERTLRMGDLVGGPHAVFAATGITNGDFLRGVAHVNGHSGTHSVVAECPPAAWRAIHGTHQRRNGHPTDVPH